MNLKTLCQKRKRIPIEYRKNKLKAINLLNEIKKNNVEIKNPDIFSLASWVGFNIGKYNSSDLFSEVEEIKYQEKENTYDIHVKRGNSYVANGIVCHNTINLPENATVENISEIYKAAWKEKCKGITVYRKNSRTGVLVDQVSNSKKDHIKYHNAPKRPQDLPCDIYRISVKGNPFFVLVGTLYGKPYEIFAGTDNENIISHSTKKGILRKLKRGIYSLCDINNQDNYIHKDISTYIGEDYEAITRLVSSNLRHGCDVNFVVHQLEKTSGDLMSFAKAVSRVLKKYIKEGSAIHGEECPECKGPLKRQEGCMSCTCGFTKCL